MSGVTYTIEPAKSNRSTCKKCKNKIEKDDVRVGTHRQTPDDMTFTTWNHLNCFTIPKKTPAEVFLQGLDMSDLNFEQQTLAREKLGNVYATASPSPKKAAAVPAEKKVAKKKPAVKKKKRSIDDSDAEDDGDDSDVIEIDLADSDEEIEEVKKKKPRATSSKKAKVDEPEPATEEERVNLKYRKMTMDELKDYLRWNGLMVSGKKDELVARCVDGELHGALPHCPEQGCKGKLKLENNKVVCGGAYNEDVGAFVRCFFKADPHQVKRHPWRFGPKTEEEIAAETQFVPTIDTSTSGNLFDSLDISTTEGKREAVSRLIEAAKSNGINLPEVEQEAKVKIGTLLMTNAGKSPNEILNAAEKMFGTKQQSIVSSQGSKAGTVCPDNEGIVAALSELSAVYFKTGNAQAGNTYRKAASAVRQYPQKITSGKALSTGKNKVDGIGAKCGELIDEYLTTGTLSKLAEKKAE